MLNEIIECLKCKSMDKIIEACNDIYEYRYITGILSNNSIVRRMSKETCFKIQDLCEAIMDYATTKLQSTIKLLMLERTFNFIK